MSSCSQASGGYNFWEPPFSTLPGSCQEDPGIIHLYPEPLYPFRTQRRSLYREEHLVTLHTCRGSVWFLLIPEGPGNLMPAEWMCHQARLALPWCQSFHPAPPRSWGPDSASGTHLAYHGWVRQGCMCASH